MPLVFAPVEGHTGTVAGVVFDDGRAECNDPKALAYFQRHGYRIERPAPRIKIDVTGDVDPAAISQVMAQAFRRSLGLTVQRPARNAPKAEWLAYAESQGASPTRLAEATKAALIKKYGA